MRKLVLTVVLTVLSLAVFSQDAIIYKEGQNRVLVVYVKDSVFSCLDERSNAKRVIAYKGRKVRFNQVRFDYAGWWDFNRIIMRY